MNLKQDPCQQLEELYAIRHELAKQAGKAIRPPNRILKLERMHTK